MITRCPYKDCAYQWQQDDDCPSVRRSSNGFLKGLCAKCSRPATLKPIEIWQQLERKVAYLGGKNSLSGGPGLTGSNESDLLLKIPLLSVILEDIRSLHNVGSIFRSSDAFGFQQLYLCGITGTPDRKDVRKTSLTAENHICWLYHMSALDAVLSLRKSGAKVIALERCEGSVDIASLTAASLGPSPLCLVLGNEVSGVSEEVLALSDLICHIPMRGMKESLNVSVAFGVAAFSLVQALGIAQP